MANTIKYVTLISLIFGLTSLFISCNKKSMERIDDLTPISNEYMGYRIELVNIEASEEKGDVIKMTGTLINTGRKKVSLPHKNTKNLVINFEEALQEKGMGHLTKKMTYALSKQKLILEPGQLKQGITFLIKQEPGEALSLPAEEFVAKGQDLGIDACPDLRIDTFFVSKRTKKYAEISFKIVNVGDAPAAMFGETKAVEDNVAIRAYASGTAKLSRGDLIMGGAYIESGLKDKNGLLQPQESFAGAFRVDIRKKTRHMPYIIISIDDYQNLWECDEGNNVKKLLYK